MRASELRIWLRTTCGPKSRSGRSRFRSWQSRSGRSNTIAHGRQWYSRASSTSGLPRLRLDVRRVDDRQPARGQPLARDEVERPRRRRSSRLVVLVVRDERPAEVGREHLGRPEVLARERRLARARRADEHDQREVGNLELRRCAPRQRSNTAICVGGADLGVLRADRAGSATAVAVTGRRPRRPSPRTRRASTRSGGRGGGTARRAATRSGRCTRGSASSGRPSPAGRARTATRSNAAQPRRSRCSITSTTAAASKPASRGPGRSARPGGASPARAAAAAGGRGGAVARRLSSARCETSSPTTSSNGGSASSARSSFPSPQPRSSTRFAPLCAERRDDRAEPLLVQAELPLDRLFLGLARRRSRRRGRVVLLGDQPLEGVVAQPAPVLQVAGDDQLALGVGGSQPSPRASSFSTSSSPTQ